MSFTDRFFAGVRKYLTERGFKFSESEMIVDVYEDESGVHCVVREYNDDYRNILLPSATLADVVARGRIGQRM